MLGLVLSSAKVHFGQQMGEHKVSPLHWIDKASYSADFNVAEVGAKPELF